jgi:hypothetical protein
MTSKNNGAGEGANKLARRHRIEEAIVHVFCSIGAVNTKKTDDTANKIDCSCSAEKKITVRKPLTTQMRRSVTSSITL